MHDSVMQIPDEIDEDEGDITPRKPQLRTSKILSQATPITNYTSLKRSTPKFNKF